MTPDPARPTPLDAFVSYSHKDKGWVIKLVTQLRRAKKGARPLSVGLDEEVFVPGVSLIRQIERAVRTSTRLICVLSPDYLDSDWGLLEAEMKTLDDPAGRKGFLVPILYRNCDVPYFMKIRMAADFRQIRKYEHSLRRLAWILGATIPGGAPLTGPTTHQMLPPSSVPQSSAPEPIQERLCLNLFEATTFPREVFSGETECGSTTDVLTACGGPPLGGEFVIRGDRLYSLDNLGDSNLKLSRAVSGSVERLTWEAINSNQGRIQIHVDLLNRIVGRRCHELDMSFDRRYRRYYFPLRHGRMRYVVWPGLKKKARRRVARAVTRVNGEIIRVEHAAVHAGFARIGGKYYLQLLPTRTVTTDGFTPMRGRNVGKIIGRLTRRAYNDAFWMDVMFWLSLLLAPGQFRDSGGGVRLAVSSAPVSADIGKGVIGDEKGLFSRNYSERWAEFAKEADDAEFSDDLDSSAEADQGDDEEQGEEGSRDEDQEE